MTAKKRLIWCEKAGEGVKRLKDLCDKKQLRECRDCSTTPELVEEAEEVTFPWADDFYELPAPSEDAETIINRLESKPKTMQEVYKEIEEKITETNSPIGDATLSRQRVLGAVIDCAVISEAARETRKDKQRLEALQGKIKDKALELYDLLEDFEGMQEDSYVFSDARTHPLVLFRLAGEETGPRERKFNFQTHIRPRLIKACGAGLYSARYMPTFRDLLEVLISEMDRETPQGIFPETNAASKTRQASRLDFVRALKNRLAQERGRNIPQDFDLSVGALEDVTAVVLDLPGIKGESLKRRA